MSEHLIWQPLEDELCRLRDEGRDVTFWLRDDDAVVPTPALERLLDLTRKFFVPCALAIIPAQTGEPLAQRLREVQLAQPVMHGWNHRNHAPYTEKKQELGPHRPVDAVLRELVEGRTRLLDLYGESFVPMLVPPWNRISSGVLSHLAELGFTSVSCFGDSPAGASVPVINTHLDPIDWRGSRGCLAHELLIERLTVLVRQQAQAGKPLGILSHHLVHDESVWLFLARLFERTQGRWQDVRELIGSQM